MYGEWDKGMDMGNDLEKRIAALDSRLGKSRGEGEDEPELYVVRLYDGFDNLWMDVSPPMSHEEAEKIWKEKTKGGTYKTSYDDIDYFRIFSADTLMHFSYEAKELKRKKKC